MYLQSRQVEEERQREHLVEYQELLQDLECWATETYSQIAKDITFTSVAAVQEHINLNQVWLSYFIV